MDDDDTNNDNDNDNSLIIDTSSLTIPIIEENEKLFSSMSTNLPSNIPSEIDDKFMIKKDYEENNETIEDTNSRLSNLDYEKISSPPVQSHSPKTIISTILDTVITQIELNDNNNNNKLNSLPIIEDDQLEVEEDDDDEEENEEEDEEESPENPEKSSSSSTKSNKIEKERIIIKSSILKPDLKPTTRTLRSHARKKINLSTLNQTLANSTNNNNRRVSNRRRALENKILLATNEKEKKRKSISERLKKDKDNIPLNEDNQTSSNSDDQINETITTTGKYKNLRNLLC